MSRGGWVDFRAVKQAVSLGTVLGHYRVDWLKRSGKGQLRGRCPIHRRGAQDAFHASLRRWASAAMAAPLAGKCRLRVLDLSAGEQPDRLSSEQIRQLLNQAVGV